MLSYFASVTGLVVSSCCFKKDYEKFHRLQGSQRNNYDIRKHFILQETQGTQSINLSKQKLRNYLITGYKCLP